MAVSFLRGSFLSLSRNRRDFDYLARDLARHCGVICPDVAGRGDREWPADKGYVAGGGATRAR